MATAASQGLTRRLDDASFGFASAAVPVIRLLDPESAHRAAVLLGWLDLCVCVCVCVFVSTFS